MHVLVVNCGSSSLKFDVVALDAADEPSARPAHGEVDRVGDDATLVGTSGRDRVERSVDAPDHVRALHVALDWLTDVGLRPGAGIDVIAHRVVHGGTRFVDATLVDDHVVRGIDDVTELAPLHNGPALAVLRAARDAFGADVPMVAAFDTAFHSAMPPRAAQYAIDPALAARHGVRRYGFHGLAHRSMIERLPDVGGPDPARSRVVTLQLGNGCSAAAVDRGRSIDTSMGLTPLEGLVMGTRSGDTDPTLPAYVAEREGISVGDVDRWLNTRSGLLGVSGRSRDMRDLLDAARRGDARAALAVEMFCYRATKYVGAYVAGLGGADAIVFGGGIGEHAAEVRRRVLEPLGWAGVVVDAAANDATVDGREGMITASGATLHAWVVAVDEAGVVARDAARVAGTRPRDDLSRS